ncbi:MAG: hypothetical protein A2359_01295 [Candidatus Moranbacteria bacterium RIFOXYB1_FULL_43_19]|nr:MAG: hypothetical protein A2359_01295 [Candidatus Moranbacteria bacterium RIFOXYB1_FULL_43_19]OGI28894.1 MAG: hypothetical protein A2184_00645 [Candidatus Moranbacteria bacterium RIFOXYA1_FULL_44_7]OGI34089.1 MAG: hypothetical protein A2420_02865 [Candidatus Moranbacteria bacterium RIFOXYC1_FULL_44_13]OGI38110.1 MAG: hypothetical protein A2612_03625 [Candidatus Moranbacteria bacterium RIFOXYD1_FULL_44_12]
MKKICLTEKCRSEKGTKLFYQDREGNVIRITLDNSRLRALWPNHPKNCKNDCPWLDLKKGCDMQQMEYCPSAHKIIGKKYYPDNCVGPPFCAHLNIEKGCLAGQTTYCSRAQLLGA